MAICVTQKSNVFAQCGFLIQIIIFAATHSLCRHGYLPSQASVSPTWLTTLPAGSTPTAGGWLEASSPESTEDLATEKKTVLP